MVVGDIADLIFSLNFKYHVIKGPCEFMEGGSSLYILTLPSLRAIGIVIMDIYSY